MIVEQNAQQLLFLFHFIISSTICNISINCRIVQSEESVNCGGIYTLVDNSILRVVSPNYPEKGYPNNANCLWQIQCKVNMVKMEMKFFELEQYDNYTCPDRLWLSLPGDVQQEAEEQQQLNNHGCNSWPEKLIFKHRAPFSFNLTFQSDEQFRYRGFELEITGKDLGPPVPADCGRTYRLKKRNTKFALHTPNWPLNYPKNSECRWTIENPLHDQGHYIKMEMIHFDTLQPHHMLIIHSKDDDETRHQFTGQINNKNKLYFFKTERLEILFLSDNNYYDGKFHIEVSTTKQAECPRTKVRCPGTDICIPMKSICDGKIDCPGEHDENLSVCNVHKNCGKQQIPLNIELKESIATKAKPGSWPWAVSIHSYTFPKQVLCEATLISPKWILTTAYCALKISKNTAEYFVRIGSYWSNEMEESWEFDSNITNFYFHPDHQSDNQNDIALILLQNGVPIPFNKRVNIACLPEIDIPLGRRPKYANTGWGSTDLDNKKQPLYQAITSPLSIYKCNSTLKWFQPITNHMLCSVYNKPENLDILNKGGPYMCKNDESSQWQLHGTIMNYMRAWDEEEEEDEEKGFVVYTSVVAFINFIWQTMLNYENAI
ncbi:Enteropeptidase [Trichinella spiralis]|uniref:Enteropeptidase n=1 Tax=Trichinella spiralis TaxID=6334 RepID=A0A0V1ATW1_TRISP|nr:Enteropeptidase [Trichinella spiralis]